MGAMLPEQHGLLYPPRPWNTIRPAFKLKAQSGLQPEIANILARSATFTRATPKGGIDAYGKHFQALSGESVHQGSRRVRNISPSSFMSGGDWTSEGDSSWEHVGGEVHKFTFPTATSGGTYSGSVLVAGTGVYGVCAIDVKLADDAVPTGSGRISLADGNGNGLLRNVTPTSEWQRVYFGGLYDGNNAGLYIYNNHREFDGQAVLLRRPQIENQTGDLRHVPSEHVPVGATLAPNLNERQILSETPDNGGPTGGTGTETNNGDGTWTLADTDAAGATHWIYDVAIATDNQTYKTTITLSQGTATSTSVRLLALGVANRDLVIDYVWATGIATVSTNTLKCASYFVVDNGDGTVTFTLGGIDDGANNSIRAYVYPATTVAGNTGSVVVHGNATVSRIQATGVKYFPWHNGNTVDTSGVVTEATGPEINSNTSCFLDLQGNTGDGPETSDSAAASVTGDIRVVGLVMNRDHGSGGYQTILSKRDNNSNVSYDFGVNPSGQPYMYWSPDGTTGNAQLPITTNSLPYDDGELYWLLIETDMDNGSVAVATFYTHPWVGGNTPPPFSDFGLFQTMARSSTSSIQDNGSLVRVGGINTGFTAQNWNGLIGRAQVYDGIGDDATLVVDFNPNDYEAGSTFTSPTSGGELVNGRFDTDSNWTLDANGGGGNQSISDGQLTLTQGGSSVWMATYQEIDVTHLSSLRVTGTMVSASSGGNKRIGLHTNANASATPNIGWVGTTNTSNTQLTDVFDVAAYSAVYLLIVDGQAPGHNSVWDDISTEAGNGIVWTLNGNAKVFSPKAHAVDTPGSSGDYISTPDSTAADASAGFTQVWCGVLDDYTPTSSQQLTAKWLNNGNQRSYQMWVDGTDDTLAVAVSSSGANSSTSKATISIPVTDGVPIWLRATHEPSGPSVTFYYSFDNPWKSYNKITWTQLGDAGVSSSYGTPYNSTASFQIAGIGATSEGDVQNASGKVFRAAMIDSTDPTVTPSVDWDARIHTPGVATATGPDGVTWTIHGNCEVETNIPAPWDEDGPVGVSIHGARTNLETYSEEMTNAVYTNNNIVAVANAETFVDGTLTAYRADIDATSSTHAHFRASALTVSTATDYASSVWLKNDGVRYVQVRHGWDSGSGDYAAFVVDLQECTITDSNAANTTTLSDYGIKVFPGGWIWAYIVSQDSANTTLNFIIEGSDSATPTRATNGSITYLGVAGEDFYFNGRQTEAGSFPTSYIPTGTSAVARNADVLTYTSPVSTWPLTIHAEVTVEHPTQRTDGSNDIFINANDGTADNRSALYLQQSDDNLYVFSQFSGGADVNEALGTVPIDGVTYGVTGTYADDNVTGYVDGQSRATDVVNTPPTGFTTITFARETGVDQINGYLRNVMLFNKTLNDSQVAAL